MKTTIGRVAAAASAIVAGTTALAVGPDAAYASDVNPVSASALCGSGYKQVDSHAIEGAVYFYLEYNSSNGKNCAVALKQRDIGGKDQTDVYMLTQKTLKQAEDDKPYTSYAAPIYLTAPGECIEYGGFVVYGSQSYTWNSKWVACG